MNLISFKLNNRHTFSRGRSLPSELQLSYTIRCNGSTTPNDLRITYRLSPRNTPQHIKFDNNGNEVIHTKELMGFSGNVDDSLIISSTAPFSNSYQIEIEITPQIDNHKPISPELLVLTITGNKLPTDNPI